MIAESNTSAACSTSSDLDDDDIDPIAIADALEDVISDIDGFLTHWRQRLVDNFEMLPSNAASDELLRRQMDDLEQKKLRWKARQESEEQRIREKAEQVTEAWLRLEAEQRKFLQIKESYSNSAGQRTAPVEASGRDVMPARCESSDTGSTENERIASEAHAAIESQPPKRCHSIRVKRPRDGAMQQFQQLRREIELSRPGSGKL